MKGVVDTSKIDLIDLRSRRGVYGNRTASGSRRPHGSPARRRALGAAVPATAAAAAVLLGAALRPAAAQTTFTWSGGGSDANFSTVGNWAAGNAPNAAVTSSFIFPETTSLAPLVDADYLTSTLTFAAGAQTYTLKSANSGVLDFSNTPITLISQNANYAENIGASSGDTLTLNVGGSALTLDYGAGTGSLTLNAVLTGTGTVSLSPGSQTPATVASHQLILNAANTFSGTYSLDGGNVVLAKAGALGTANVTVNSGTLAATTALTLTNNFTMSGTLNFAGTTTSAVTLSGVLSGNGSLTQEGQNVLTLSGANTYNGATTITVSPLASQLTSAPGTVTIASGGSLASASLNIGGDGILSVAAGGALASSPQLALSNGQIVITAGTQPIGTVLLNGGYNYFTLSASSSKLVSSSSLLRNGNATFLLRGPSGSALSFTSVPAGLVGGGGASSTTYESILPYVISGTSAGATGTFFATVDTSGGVSTLRPLTTAETVNTIADSVSGSTTAQQSNFRGNSSATIPANGGTVNSLWITSGTIANAAGTSGTLTVTSGAISTSGGAIGISAPLAFGSQEAVVFSPSGTLTISGNMTGSGGFTKGATGTVALTGNNAGLTGLLTIDAGQLQISALNNLPGTGAIQLYGGGATRGGITDAAAAGTGLTIARDIVTNDVAEFNATNAGETLTLSGTLSGVGSLVANGTSGTGTIALTGANTYLGSTKLAGGTLQIASDGSLGSSSGALDLGGGTLLLTGNWTASRPVSLSAASTISTNGNSASLSGVLSGTSALTKTGSGTLALTGANAFSGTVTISGGSLSLSGSGALATNTYTVGSGATLALDNSGTTGVNRVSDTGTVSLGGGTFSLTGNSAAATSEKLGTLSLSATGGTVLLATPSGETTSLLLTTYTPGSGSVVFAGNNLGVVGTGTATSVFISSLTTGQFLAGASYLNTATNQSGLAYYDPTVGVRLATSSDYVLVGANETTTGYTAIQNAAPINLPSTVPIRTYGAVAAPGAANTVQSINLESGSTIAIDSGGTLTVTTGSVVFELEVGSGQSISGGTLAAGTGNPLSFDVQGSANSVTVSSALSGANGLTKSDPGSLVLTAPYGVTGALSVGGGTLSYTGGGTLNLGSGSVNVSSTLRTNGAGITTTGAATVASGGVLNSGGGALSLGTTIVNGSLASGGGALSVGGTLTVSGTADTGSGNLTVGSSGTSTLTINSGGTLATGTGSITAGPVVLNGVLTTAGASAVTALSGAGTLNLSSAANFAVTSTGATTFSGQLAGSGTLTIQPSGTTERVLTFGGNSTGFIGSVVTNAITTTTLTNPTALGSGTLYLNDPARSNTSASTQVAVTFSGGTTATYANNFALSTAGGTVTPFTNGTATGQTSTLSGIISGGANDGNTYLSFTGASDNSSGFVLSNANNSFAATVQVVQGYVGITSNAALGNAANNIYLRNLGANNDGLQFDANNINLTHNITLNAPFGTSASTSVGSAIDTNGYTATISGTISGDASQVTNTNGLTLSKVGAGTLILTNTGSTFNGNLAVNAGVIGGVGLSAASITLNAGGTIAPGTGTAAGSAGIGTFSGANFTFNGGALNFDLGSTSSAQANDSLSLSGFFNRGSSSSPVTFTFSDAGETAGGTYTVATFAPGQTNFTSSDFQASGANGTFVFNPAAGTLLFQLASAGSTPEPGSLALVLMGAGMVVVRRKRK